MVPVPVLLLGAVVQVRGLKLQAGEPTQYQRANQRSPDACSQTLYDWFQKTFEAHPGQEVSVLDVGGGSGEKTLKLRKMGAKATCIDIAKTQECSKFSGVDFSEYPDKSFDYVLMTYVLHHARGNEFTLVADAARIAKKQVLILEDLPATEEAMKSIQCIHTGCWNDAAVHFTVAQWRRMDRPQYHYDYKKGPCSGCNFRSDAAWTSIFHKAGYNVTHGEAPSYNCYPAEADKYGWEYRIPRAFYVLSASGQGATNQTNQS